MHPPPSPYLHDQVLELLPYFLEVFQGNLIRMVVEVKKRKTRSVNQEVMAAFSNLPEARARTVGRNKAPEWQLNTKYIIRGYHPGDTGYLEVVQSLKFLHSETCNRTYAPISLELYSYHVSQPASSKYSLILGFPAYLDETVSYGESSSGVQNAL